jgi:branched-chain amino acid transport system substrate-binding protein
MRIERLAFRFLLLALGLLSLAGCHRKSSPEIVYVGHVAAFRGPDKLSGEHARQGIALALEEAEGADGTINDRRIEVIHVDSGGDVKAVEPAAVRLAAVNKVVALLGGTSWAQAEPMTPVAQSNEIPLIISCGLPGQAAADYVFHTGLSPEQQAEELAKFASRFKPPLKKIAILIDGIDKSPSSFLAGKFTREFLKDGKSLAGEWTYKEYRRDGKNSESAWEFKNTDDLKEIMGLLKKRGPDAVFLAGAASDLARLRKAGLDEKLPLFFAGEEGSDGILRSQGGSQPIFAVTGFVVDQNERQKAFAAKYESKFHEPPDAYAAFAYENTRILLEAMSHVSSFKGSKIKEALESLSDFPTLMGTVSFSKDRHWAASSAYVIRIQDGKITVESTE